MTFCGYTPVSTWIDGLIAVLIADECVEERNDCIEDILFETESRVWFHLRNKVDWEEALRWSPRWHAYYPESAKEMTCV